MITSLPELFNGISAITIVNEPDLTVGNLLGANAFNMFNLALLDITCRNSSLITAASRTHQLTGWFSLLIVLFVATFILISSRLHLMEMGWMGWYTPVIILLYLVFIRIIFLFERRHPEYKEAKLEYGELSSGRLYLYFIISAVLIIGAGMWLAVIGAEIDMIYGWGKSFVGSLLLAFTTTLPEMTVSFAAMRIGAKDMAIANMIGSNLYNMTIISVDDLLYLKGSVLAAVSENHLITASGVILMTLIFIAGLHFKPGRFYRLSWWSILIIVLFVLSAYFSFTQPSFNLLSQ
jgi:cation:H+ antiporter